MWSSVGFVQAEDGIRGLVRSRGLGDVYKRQALTAEERRYPQARSTRVEYPQAAARLADRRFACDRGRHVGAETQQIGPA